MSQRDLDLQFLLEATGGMEIMISDFRSGLPAAQLEADTAWQVKLQNDRDFATWVASNPPCDAPEPQPQMAPDAKLIIAAYTAPYREPLRLERRVANRVRGDIPSDDPELWAAYSAYIEQYGRVEDVINAADDKYDDLGNDIEVQRLSRLMRCAD